jgi:hypothetical protein
MCRTAYVTLQSSTLAHFVVVNRTLADDVADAEQGVAAGGVGPVHIPLVVAVEDVGSVKLGTDTGQLGVRLVQLGSQRNQLTSR